MSKMPKIQKFKKGFFHLAKIFLSSSKFFSCLNSQYNLRIWHEFHWYININMLTLESQCLPVLGGGVLDIRTMPNCLRIKARCYNLIMYYIKLELQNTQDYNYYLAKLIAYINQCESVVETELTGEQIHVSFLPFLSSVLLNL